MLYKPTNSIRLEKVYENKEIKPRTKFEEKYSLFKKTFLEFVCILLLSLNYH